MKKGIILILVVFSVITCFASSLTHGVSLTEYNYQIGKYIKHTVVKSESISSILKKYQLPLADFLQANPQVATRGDVALGEMLNITRNSIGNATDATINKDIKKFLKERKQAVNRQEDIVPQKTKIEARQQAEPIAKPVAVPKAEPQLQKLSDSQKKFDYHNVLPKETLYSISRLYNVSIENILKYNEDVKEGGLKEYTVIRVPRSNYTDYPNAATNVVTEKDTTKPLVVPTATPTQNVELAKFDIFSDSRDTKTLNVAFVMPITGESDPREDGFKDLYRGFLMACDSLKKSGLSVNVDLYGVGRGTDLSHQLIASGQLLNKQLIIGPVFPDQFETVADYAIQNNIPIINPLLATRFNAKNIIEITPDKAYYYDKIQNMFDDKYVIYYKSVNDDAQFVENIQKIKNIDTTIVYDKFITPDSMATTLSKDKENIFIVAAKDNLNNELLLSKLVALKATAYNQKMSVLASQHVSNIPKERRGDFFRCDLHYITSSFQDRTNEASMKFETDYIHTYSLVPSPFSYRGYEIGIIIMGAINENGSDFMNELNDTIRRAIQVPYMFYRENDIEKLVNQEWLLINYSPNFSINVK